MRKILPFFILLFAAHAVYSQQIREFAMDTVEYTRQLQGFMSGIDEDQQPLLDRFITAWKSDSITVEDKLRIMTVSNLMLSRRARPDPDFLNYLTLYLMNFSGKFPGLGLDKLLESFNHLAANREVPFRQSQRFLSLSLDIIRQRNLYDLAGNQWKANGGSYRFIHRNYKPFVDFESVDLYCYANRDTLQIANTHGSYNLLSLEWRGEGGRVNWQRAGLDPNQVYADLSRYRIRMNRSEYEADTVRFMYKKYFDYPLEGRLEDKALPISNAETAIYPKFFSYQNKYILPDLFPGIEFIGGLSMQGSKLVGTGSDGVPARLNISEKDTLRMVLLANDILIREKSMSSQGVRMTLYLENDSIYHPDLQFIYFENEDRVSLTRGDRYTSGVPFHDSYHKIDMSFEELEWKRGTGTVRIKPSVGRSLGQASFESNNLFNYRAFDQLQGMDYVNPLVSLWQFSKQVNGLRKFPVAAYANNMGIAPYQVRQQLMKLSRLGFVYFDDQSDVVVLNDKLFYYLDASVGKTDYDVIYFISKVNAPADNGRLDLKTRDLTIYGVPNIFLSDSQNVVLIPDEKKIVMKRNRNFQFNGEIRAGLMKFYGSNFFFQYDSFKINLQNVDSLKMQVMESDKNTGTSRVTDIHNLIEHLTGELLIDEPSNKSGLKNFPQYPVFSSRENSYVYFDDPSIQKGVYDREHVYFTVDTFRVDSLDNFDRRGLNLKGTFESSGMLPPLDLALTFRKDNSLGFNYSTAENGVPVYNGKGTFYHDLEMSSKGLHGAGRLEYLASTTFSDDFILHPDSVMATGREFTVDEQLGSPSFPTVRSANDRIKWLTKKDQFFAFQQDMPFTMYNDTILFKGDLLVEPKGLSGRGTVDMISASVGSENFLFRSKNILADSSGFRLNSPASDEFAISADNIRSDIDFEKMKGSFASNEDYTLVSFPDIRYVSNLDFFTWDMKNEIIEMGLNKSPATSGSSGEDTLTGPRYISVKPSQDSLNFVAPLAIYDYRKSLLNAKNVPYIRVADARIYPDQGNVTIRQNANMQTLSGAGIIADNTHEYYSIYDASVSINGRNEYSASGYYDYTGLTGEPEKIFFNKITVDTALRTIGNGEITLLDSFRLSPFFQYQGKVSFTAREPHIFFDGGARIVHDCQPGRAWLKFKATIDPDSVRIPVSEAPMDINLKPTYFSTFITRDSTHIYSAFSSGRHDFFDAPVTHASGYLKYNRMQERYEVASAEKLANPNLPGNFMSLDRSSCKVYSEGDIDFQVDYGQLKMKTVGTAVHDTEADTFSTRVLMALDFYFSSDALREFGRELDSLTSLKPYDLTDPFYKKSIRELAGEDAAKRMEADMSLYGEYRNIPASFSKTIVMSDVRLKWNQSTRTYRYHGPLAILRVGDRQVSKQVEAYIELTKRSTGDLLDIYFVLNDRSWYYFGYNPGSLQTVSSNRVYNGIVFDLKPGQRKLKAGPGNKNFIYSLAADRRAQLFLRRYLSSEKDERGLSETQ